MAFKRKKEEIAKIVRDCRKTLGLKQKEVAVAFSVGRSTVAKWETGENMIPGDYLFTLLLSTYKITLTVRRPSSF